MRIHLADSQLLAECPEPPAHSQHASLVLYCPACGDVWARVERAPWWVGLPSPCRSHGTPLSIGGSFFNHGYPGVDPRPTSEVDYSAPESLERFLLVHPQLLKYEAQVHALWLSKFHPEKQHAPLLP